MKTILKKGVAFATMTLALSTTYSQLKISGEIRPRFEYKHGYKALADSAANNGASIDQRTRLNFDYKKDQIKFRVSLQDVRTWGNQSQLVGNEDFGISVHEAWGEATSKDKLHKLKFGRQELAYDDHRILGSVGWAQQARSHDALLYKYGKNKLMFHTGLAYNQNGSSLNSTSYINAKSYKAMQYIWANYTATPELKISLLAMSVGQQVNKYNTFGELTNFHDNYTLTTGTRITYNKEKIGIDFSGYYQLGATSEYAAREVAAYNLNIAVSYKVNDKITTTLGYAMLSGNDNTDTTASYAKTEHSFSPYFGTNHKFNGFMDYFYVGNHGGSIGLNDAFLKVDYKHEKFTAGITAHAFLANANILDTKEQVLTGEIKAMDPYLGTEFDVYGAFKLVPSVTCKIGYSHMLGTASMEAIKGGDMNEVSNWGYVMLIMKPTLFQGK
jgi:hypothetical protein